MEAGAKISGVRAQWIFRGIDFSDAEHHVLEVYDKAIAMEMILNNRTLTAQEAHQFGLVNRVVSVADYLNEALKLAEEVAGRAPLALMPPRR
jgi:enoyl-CoA hydratase/carnithine racemase